MIYLISSILAVLGVVAGYIYKLFNENRSLKEKAANDAAVEKTKEWNDKIKVLDGKVSEDERDYEAAKKEFDDNNNPPSSGAV